MENTNKYLLPTAIFGAIVIGFLLSIIVNTHVNQAVGSTIQGNDYYSTTTSSANASGVLPFVVKRGNGSFGSVIVTGTSTSGIIRIYDHTYATGTQPFSQGRGEVIASSTLIATLGGGISAGTYTFDRTVNYGIVVDVPVGFTGNYVITYR